uniref:Uncharacterized protein TCIL3000_8_3800 n=1 Tax=Trypanosoma congolense (strain IL3000) TaxID=1068625 RepID=G0URZ9_TRYCI|nr:unnamed protein product [Trypanosoma congolense IL3000]
MCLHAMVREYTVDRNIWVIEAPCLLCFCTSTYLSPFSLSLSIPFSKFPPSSRSIVPKCVRSTEQNKFGVRKLRDAKIRCRETLFSSLHALHIFLYFGNVILHISPSCCSLLLTFGNLKIVLQNLIGLLTSRPAPRSDTPNLLTPPHSQQTSPSFLSSFLAARNKSDEFVTVPLCCELSPVACSDQQRLQSCTCDELVIMDRIVAHTFSYHTFMKTY